MRLASGPKRHTTLAGRPCDDVTLSKALLVGALGYVALVFFRPSEVIPGWGAARLVLGAAVIMAPLLILAWWRQAALPIDQPHDRWLLGYWLAIGVSNVASGWLSGAVLGLEQFAPIVFLYVLLRTAVTRPVHLRCLVGVLTAAMVFQAVGVIAQSHTGVGWAGVTPFIEKRAGRGRSVGIFNDPNDLALGFLLVLPFLLAGVAGRDLPLRLRATSAAIAAPLLVAFRYANSRGAMLGLAVSVCVYCGRRFGFRLGAAIAVLALAALLAVAPSRLAILTDTVEPSAQGRIVAWAAGLEMLKSSPLTGVGWNRSAEHHERPAHNSFLHAFSELGLVGGGCFVALVYSFFWGLRRTWDSDVRALHGVSNLEHALTSAGAGFFVGAFFLSKQYSVMTFTLVALGAVFYSVVNRATDATTATFGRRQWLSIAALSTGVLLVIWVSVRVLNRGG